MKILTICQPWAWAILRAGKRVENRTWGCSYRGPLLIHAGLSRSYLGALETFYEDYGIHPPDARDLVFGAAVGICELAACVKLGEWERWTPEQRKWIEEHPFTEGPYCWVLKNVRALRTPIPCLGQRGLWDVPPDLLAALG